MSRVDQTAGVDLAPCNTLGLQARAQQLLRVRSLTQLEQAMAAADWNRQPRLVLGGGSNVVLPAFYPGTVLKIELGGRRLLDTEADNWLVEAAAGENWHDFVCWTLEQGWPGLENLALIPGTAGAAPIQNIGAYGVELAQRFAGLDAIELSTGERCSFDLEQCGFGYRDSIFKQQPGRWLVLAVRFRLPRPWQPVLTYAALREELELAPSAAPTAAEIAAAVIRIRQRKLPDPAQLGNAGSFFKNPVVAAAHAAVLLQRFPTMPHYPQADGRTKLAAGWLIEQAGWKGRRLGPMGCYQQQALVLVNHGGAERADVERIAQQIEADVRHQFAIELEPEPFFV